MVTVLTDADVVTRLAARDAVRWMAEAVDAHHRGELVAPPRVHSELAGGRLVYTAGHLRGTWFGYRSYDTFRGGPGAQLVVVQNEGDGEVRAVAVGRELGPRRVGAMGGVAADVLTPPDAGVVAVIGSGVQAAMQVWGLSAVRPIRELRVCSRDPTRRKSFCERVSPLVDGTARPEKDPEAAVDGADIVVLATSSSVPVVASSWLGPSTYVTTVGPKQRGSAEWDLDLPGAAAVVVADSPAQVDAYDPPNLLTGTPHRDRMVSLGEVRAGSASLPPGGVRVFFSVGLAGTEAFLLARLTSSIA